MPDPAPEILLIHGSCHGAWCWEALIAHLAPLGIRPRAIDLPGRNAVASTRGITLHDHAEAILAAIDTPLTLLGHSAGGYAISLAAELRPDLIRRLVYLTAYVPLPGVSLADRRRAAPDQPLKPAIRIVPELAAFSFDPAMAPDLLYHDCPEDVQARAIARLCPEPITPQEDAIASLDHWQAMEKHYIRCTADRAIPPRFQAEMSAGWPAALLHSLPASHSPFLSMPARLARCIAGIALPPAGASA